VEIEKIGGTLGSAKIFKRDDLWYSSSSIGSAHRDFAFLRRAHFDKEDSYEAFSSIRKRWALEEDNKFFM